MMFQPHVLVNVTEGSSSNILHWFLQESGVDLSNADSFVILFWLINKGEHRQSWLLGLLPWFMARATHGHLLPTMSHQLSFQMEYIRDIGSWWIWSENNYNIEFIHQLWQHNTVLWYGPASPGTQSSIQLLGVTPFLLVNFLLFGIYCLPLLNPWFSRPMCWKVL